MPTTIPYDPSLVLGNIVSQAKLDNLTAISSIQAPVDAAEDELNSLIALKRSIDMTVQELIDMKINSNDLIKESDEVGKKIQAAAVEYAKVKLDAETKIQPLKGKIRGVNDEIESPMDYNRTQIKKMPLSADSLKMNCQYFSFDENEQDSSTHAATVSSFVSGEVDFFGDSFSGSVSESVQSQMNSQHERHSISGTLVVTITCTHKDAVLLAPLILDVDKAIRAWNKVFPDEMIKTDSLSNIAQIATQANTKEEKSLTIVSGATYGSCFVGMVHVLNTSKTTSSETMYSIATKLQEQFHVNGWFVDESGGFGVDSSFSADAKNLLSTQNISSHCSLITMGSIPSIKSKEVRLGVKEFKDFDGASSMAALMQLRNATNDEMKTIDSSANAARTGQQMINLQNSKMDSALTALAKIDDGANKMIDINSVMEALDDYVQKCLGGNIGVPVNYYLKPITRSQLAQMWMTKYYPGKYLSISGDDSTPAGGGGATPGK
jgi:hypothetical protein